MHRKQQDGAPITTIYNLHFNNLQFTIYNLQVHVKSIVKVYSFFQSLFELTTDHESVSYLRDRVWRIFAGESTEEAVAVSCGNSGQVEKQGAFRGDCVLPLHTSLLGSLEHPKRPPCPRLRHAPSLLSTMGFHGVSGRAWESPKRFHDSPSTSLS